MKNIKLSQVVADALLEKLSLMKNATNKVRLIIGMKNAGNGITCKAQIVDDMRMEEIGFTTEGVPSDFKEGETYCQCIVKAADLCGYLSAFSVFNSEIAVGIDEKALVLSVDGQATVSLECVAESEAEPLFADDAKMTMAVFACSGKVLGDALKMGGFCAVTTDNGAIADRVVLSFTDGNLGVYSTDLNRSKLASCDAQIKTSFNEPFMAMVYLRDKGSKISKEEQAALKEKMSKASKEQIVVIAKEEGFVSGVLDIAVPTSNVQIVQKLIAGAEKVEAQITTKYLRIRSGNVLATFCLAGTCPNIYKNVLPKFEAAKWGGSMVVDKEQMVNALNIIQLSPNGKSYPFALSVAEGKLVMKDISGNTTKCAIVSSNGDMANLSKFFYAANLSSILTKFPNGNIVVSMDSKKNTFLQVRNGELSGANASVKTYLLEVNMEKLKEEKAREEAKKAEKEAEEACEE